MSVTDRYILFFERLHVRVFGAPAGKTTRFFIHQLHWSMVGGFLASVLFFAVAVWAGRVLGTGQYGKYSFIIAFAQVISLAMTWGFDLAITRALSVTHDDVKSKKYVISSATFFLVCSAVIVNILIFLLPLPFQKPIVMLLATSAAMKSAFDGMVRGLGLFAYQALMRVIEACAVAVLFFALIHSADTPSSTHYLVAVLGGSVVIIPWYLVRLRGYNSFRKISYSAVRMLWSYGSIVIISTVIATLLIFATRFIIRYALGYEFLGQFTVYYMTSISMLGLLGGLIANVLFTVAVREGHSDAMWHKMHRTAMLISIPLWIVASIATTIAIALYGPSYYLAWWFGVGMAGVGVIQFFRAMYWWLIVSTGIEGIRYASFHSGISACIFIGMLALFVSSYPLVGILVSYIVSDAYMAWAIRRWRRMVVR